MLTCISLKRPIYNIKLHLFSINLDLTCNFDVSMCGFEQGKDDKFDWTRHNGSTPSSDTGPPFDHTTGTGEL